MKVKVIMMPRKKLHCVSMDETVGEAMNTIDEHGLLSLPVVDGTKFIGVLSKQYSYERFFKDYDCTREEFLQHKVREMMKERVETVDSETAIEDAAALFISSKVRFIPVTDREGNLEGIVTQQSIFKEYQKLFGTKYNSLTIQCEDYRGVLGKLADTIAKAGGNIKNMVQIDTEAMDIQEMHVSIQAPDFEKVVAALEKHGYDIRNIKYVVPVSNSPTSH